MLSYRFIGRTEPSACGSEIKLGSNVVEFIDVAVVRAKNEALFPGRVPHVRQAYMGRKRRGAAPPNAFAMWRSELRPRAKVLAHGVKALEESVFGPCTLGEHGAPVQNRRPWFGDQIRQSSANLIWTSLKFNRPSGTKLPSEAEGSAVPRTLPGYAFTNEEARRLTIRLGPARGNRR